MFGEVFIQLDASVCVAVEEVAFVAVDAPRELVDAPQAIKNSLYICMNVQRETEREKLIFNTQGACGLRVIVLGGRRRTFITIQKGHTHLRA